MRKIPLQKEHNKETKLVIDSLEGNGVFYQYLIEIIREAVIVHSYGKIIYINPTALQFIGASKAEYIINKPIMQFIHPDSQDLVKKQVQMLMKKKKVTQAVEEKFVSLNGDIRIAEVSASPFIFGGKQAILTIIYDITEQKRIQEELIEREERYRATFNQISVAMSIADVKGKWLTFNQAYPKMFGYTEDELKTMAPQKLMHPQDIKKNYREVRKLAQGKIKNLIQERRYIYKNGSIIYGLLHAASIRDKQGKHKYFAVAIQDITEQKKAEEAVKEEKEKLALSQKAGKVGTFEWDLKTGESKGTNEFEVLYGRKKGYVGGNLKKWINYIHPDDRNKIIKLTKQSIKKGKEFNVEFRVIWPDKTIHYLQTRAQIIRNKKGKALTMRGVTIDITKHKEAEEKIEASEKRFRALIDKSSDVISLADKAGQLYYVSPSIERLLGYTPKEFMEVGLRAVHPDDREIVMKANVELFKNPEETVQRELRLQHKNGSWKWVETNATNLLHNNNVNALVSNFRDITERKRAERQKDDFMGIVSHELKTPVTSVKAFTQVLQNRFAKAADEKSTLLLGKMDTQINKLTSLIGDLLDVTKLEGGELQFSKDPFYFDDLVAEIVEEVQRTTNNHTIEKVGMTKKTVYGDKDRIGQAIINFLTNAIKYSPHSAKIIVKMGVEKELVTLCVQDFGVGIPKEKQGKVFERFYRVSGNETIPGIGLGLYISSEIIKRQGGKIWLESERGKGSTFCFSLPIQKERENNRKI